MSNHNEDTDLTLTTPPRQNPFSTCFSPSPPPSPMAWDESYSAADSGLRLNLKHERPPITPNSRIELHILYTSSSHRVEVDVSNPDHHVPQPLSAKDLAAVKRFLYFLRREATKAVNAEKSETAHDGLLYIIRALQVRMNQHWHATRVDKEVSVDDLVGLLTMREEDGAVEGLEGLMQSLAVADQIGDESEQMVAYSDGGGGVRMLPGQDMQLMREERGIAVMNEMGDGGLSQENGRGLVGTFEPLMLENGEGSEESGGLMVLQHGQNRLDAGDEIA